MSRNAAPITLLALTLLVPAMVLAIAPTAEPATSTLSDPATHGAWSDPIPVPVSAEHMATLPTGEVLVYQTAEDAHLWDPATGELTPVPTGSHASPNCAGLAILADGSLLTVSGHSHAHGPEVGQVPSPDELTPSTWAGNRLTLTFDPETRTWEQGPDLDQARYYPTAITLDDGSVLTVSGNDETGGPAETVERLAPGPGQAWETIDPAEQEMDFYPRLHLLPSGDVVRVGQEQQALFLEQETWTWQDGPIGHYGQRWGGSSVLLPGLDQVLVTGGGSWGFGSEGHQTAEVLRDDVPGVAENVVDGLVQGSTPATGHTEILDLSGDEPTFREVEPMTFPRRDLNTVLLPTGDVLAVNGGMGWEPIPGWVEHARSPEIFDTTEETWSLMAPADRHRGYHSTAALLPDGRVLVGGGDFEASTTTPPTDEGEPLAPTLEIYSPPYLFQGDRPTIATAPQEITYDEGTFSVSSAEAGTVAGAALVRMSSVTHSLNTDQRYLQPDVSVQGSSVTIDAPTSPTEAPPGPYMLFLISQDGVPSVAEIVMVGHR